MTDFRKVTETFSVSPQIAVSDVARAKAEGFSMIINNRPDGEATDQPPGAAIEAEALALGLAYRHVPVMGRPTAEQIAAVRAAVDSANGKVLAYCRSGTRSINTWSLGQTALDRGTLVALGANAGYDLAGVLPL